MARPNYGGYRGRRTGRDWLKYLIFALVLVIAALGILYALGMLPAEAPGERPSEPDLPDAGELIPPPQAEEPEPEPTAFVMSAVGVEVEQLLDGSWKDTLAFHEGNTLVVNMKGDSGALGWQSDQPLAGAAKANSAVEGINDVIREVTSGEVYTVARISCFRDELLAGTHAYCIRSNSDYRWKDFDGFHWVNLAVPEVRDYVAGLCRELAELGFDEIVLDHCGYPQDGTGQMGWIKKGPTYDLNNLDGAVSAFLDQVRTELEGYQVVLSIRTGADVVAGEGALTGLTGAVLEEYAGHIWLSEVDCELPLAETLTLAGITAVGERLVTQSLEVSQLNSWHQALLPF